MKNVRERKAWCKANAAVGKLSDLASICTTTILKVAKHLVHVCRFDKWLPFGVQLWW